MIKDDSQARLAISVLDEKVAAIFGKRPRCPTIQFVPVIERHEVRYGDGRVVTTREIVGTCDHKNNVVTLVICDAWTSTAVHELTHLYNPGRRESWIKDMALKVGAYLKGVGPHPLGNKSQLDMLAAWKAGTAEWSTDTNNATLQES